MCQVYEAGGSKMVDIKRFCLNYKINWLKRTLHDDENLFLNLTSNVFTDSECKTTRWLNCQYNHAKS